jgi:hypothetical protein
MFAANIPSATPVFLKLRLRFGDLLVNMCRLPFFANSTFPFAVTLKRFLAPL